MRPYYDRGGVTIHVGDCLDVLRTLPGESVQTCVTSPPYWGLRDYGTATWEGGDEACDHAERKNRNDGGRQASDGFAGNANIDGHADMGTRQYRATCGKCGARRVDSQLGLEATPEEYVEKMVAVFREVRRVLRDDGTLWLNLGDSYAGGSGARGDGDSDTARADGTRMRPSQKHSGVRIPRNAPGLKPKDLVGIPWRVAFALQADGWYLRSDIIWAKPNPMPESVTDRPTKAHEYLFLLSKSARYHFDADAVREPFVRRATFNENSNGLSTRSGAGGNRNDAGRESVPIDHAGRNIRSVWNIATQPFPGAHFAVMPPKLVEPCIKAGCPAGGTVLDPFSGAGTVAYVAREMRCKAIGIELSADYAEISAKRLVQEVLPFGEER